MTPLNFISLYYFMSLNIIQSDFVGFFEILSHVMHCSTEYGRTCKDIGCRSNEVCVMAEDPCSIQSRDHCGRYPTCARSGESGSKLNILLSLIINKYFLTINHYIVNIFTGLTCTTMICSSGQYCKTVDGRPKCVNTSPDLGE